MPLFRSDEAPTTSTSRRLSIAMSSAAVASVNIDQLSGIGYSLSRGTAREALTDWSYAERSFEEFMRVAPDVIASPI